MSYNGIGLSTAKGSGTNGYVQKNIANKETSGQYERRRLQLLEKERQYNKSQKQIKTKKDREIVDHENKRQIEMRCSLLRDELEENEELEDEEIDVQVQKLREQLQAKDKSKKIYKERVEQYKALRKANAETSSMEKELKSETEAQSFIDNFKSQELDY